MKKILLSFLFTLVLLSGVSRFALAAGANVNLTVKNNGDIVYSGSVALLPAGTIKINDSSKNPHDTNADSVLSIVNTADASSGEFNISNLIYYNMFGAFYLKCINISGSELCDNWQYKVDGDSPAVGMDSKILSGGENVVLYFGDENKAPAPTPEPENPPAPSSGGGGSGIHYGCTDPKALNYSEFVANNPSLCQYENVSPSSNTKLEEKPKTPIVIETPKKLVKITKINIKNTVSKTASQNTASVISAIIPPPTTIKPETPNKNWFMKLLDSIFSVF